MCAGAEHLAGSTGHYAIKNPLTGAELYTISDPDEEAIARVHATARAAFETVRVMPVAARVAEMDKLRRYLVQNRERIIGRICEETGKPRMDAILGDIFTTLDVIDYYRKNAAKILRDQKVSTPVLLLPKKSRIYYDPLGPVLVISPWNYPFQLSLIPAISAFLAGNSVIVKPSEYTPLKGLFEEIFEHTGFVKNAIQVVYGGKDTGRRLIERRPAKVFFTGSTRAGKQVMAQAAQYLIPVELELGGKDPMIVFEDADIDRCVNGALWGGMTNCGQTCAAVERIYVQESKYSEFLSTLRAKAAKLRTIDATTGPHNADIGTMTPDFQIEKVEAQLKDAAQKGADVHRVAARSEGSHVFPPVIVSGVTDDMAITQEETFGPVVTVQPFRGEPEAIRLANSSPYGLSASVWTADLARAERVAHALETGNVSVNAVLTTQGNAALPFGGVKESGFGRYRGPFGLHTFTNIKSVMFERNSSRIEVNWYPYTEEKYQVFAKFVDTLYGDGFLRLIRAILIGLNLQRLSQKTRL